VPSSEGSTFIPSFAGTAAVIYELTKFLLGAGADKHTKNKEDKTVCAFQERFDI
jgi:hypothetical protein